MTRFLTIEEVAGICHEANRRLCLHLGDLSQPPWDAAPDWARDSAIAGVDMHLKSGTLVSPEASHASWLAHKIADGWIHGPVKDPDKKTHPCLVPFEQLPPAQQAKDWLFGGIVRALRSFVLPEPE